ncbi:MAG: glycosyltransferase family 39 protein [Paludibacter sp.]
MAINLLRTHLSNQKYRFAFFILVIIGFAIRILGISVIPAGLNQDEASIGYEAFSILKSGFDRNGNFYPIHLVSWGSGQNALYAYLSIPFIKLFGLNIFSVRIVNAILSCLTLLVFFFIFKSFTDKKKSLIALALIAICPWSIMSARWGLESNIFPALFLFGTYFLLKAINSNGKYLPIAFAIYAICLYSYGTSYLVMPLFFLFTVPYLLKNRTVSFRNLGVSSILFFVIALPIILFVLINHLQLNEIHFDWFSIPKLATNRTTVIFNLFSGNFIVTFIKNIVRFLSIIILQTDGNQYNSISSVGTIYFISFPFFLIGLYQTIKSKALLFPPNYIFFSWLICSTIVGITSHININRINIIFLPILYFTILGFFAVSKMLKREIRLKYPVFIISLYTVFFMFFCGYYFFIFKEEIKSEFSYGLGDAIHYAESTYKNDSINVTTNSINMPYIYVCFYNQTDPVVFRQSVRYLKGSNDFRVVESLGRYKFTSQIKSKSDIYILSKTQLELSTLDIKSSKNFGNYAVVQFRK